MARLILLSTVVTFALASAASASAGPVAGTMPAGARFSYHKAIHGWPVLPIDRQHPIRGSFLDPRGRDENGLAGYHFGIDINVDDSHPDLGAPPGMSHRVFALEAGYAQVRRGNAALPCVDQRVEVGHFSFWHVSPIVKEWQHISPGQQIGWTCLGQWHVHVSEWFRSPGRHGRRGKRARMIWVNPLHRGGLIAPYVDTQAPVVVALRFFSPPASPWHPRVDLTGPDSALELDATDLHGRVELRAEIGDGQSFWGFIERHPAWKTMHHPYRVAVRIASVSTGALVLDRVSFQADRLPDTPYLVHYAAGTVQNGPVGECVHGTTCSGTYWFRPFSRHREEFWDTRTVPNGAYRVTVTAWDIRMNRGSRTVRVTVAN